MTTPRGEAGQSVTSRAVAVIGRGHVPVPILYPNLAGSTARIWDPRCSLMCATQDLVHVCICNQKTMALGNHFHLLN